jgi:hypothetical protein
MAGIQCCGDGTWNVACYVCGQKLGSNKDACGKGTGKKVSKPPCVWAESDNSIVIKCQKLAMSKEQLERQKEEEVGVIEIVTMFFYRNRNS